jgi:hypothetical protein
MRARIFAVALSVAVMPSMVLAQKGGGGAPAAPAPTSSPTAAMVKLPSARDLQDLNPASLLVDKKKKASLPDSTVAQLKGVEKKINERNKQFFATYDSLHKFTRNLAADNGPSAGGQMLRGGQADAKISSGGPSAAEQAQAQAAARELRKMMAEYRDLHSADVTDALAVVPDAQKKAATDLISAQNGDLDKLVGKP